MSAMDDSGPGARRAGRLIGWKAIAEHLNVSHRTAIRWADNYGLPVSRVPRGDRPVVSADPADLDAWWDSPAARDLRGETPREERPPAGEVPPSHPGDKATPDTVNPADGDSRHLSSALHTPHKLTFLVLTGCLLVAAAGISAWYWHARANGAGSAKSGLSGFVPHVHSESASPALVEIRVTPVGQAGFTITVAEGELARLDTPSLHLGLQGKLARGQLKVLLYRLTPLRSGESADFLESRLLQPGDAVERVRIAGTDLELMWPGEIPAAVAGARVARSQCCMVCAGVTACGRNVSASCGGCQGELKLGGTER